MSALAIAGIASAAISAAGTGYQMAQGKPSLSPGLKPPPKPSDESMEEARIRERLLASRRRGRTSTMLTSEKAGATAPVKRKTLLGE